MHSCFVRKKKCFKWKVTSRITKNYYYIYLSWDDKKWAGGSVKMAINMKYDCWTFQNRFPINSDNCSCCCHFSRCYYLLCALSTKQSACIAAVTNKQWINNDTIMKIVREKTKKKSTSIQTKRQTKIYQTAKRICACYSHLWFD